MSDQTGWIEPASDTNAEVTATKAAESGRQHIIYAVSASFASTISGKLLQIKDGSTVLWEGYVYDKEHVLFPRGLSATKGQAVSAVLEAAGSAVVQKVNLHGITK